MSIDIGPGAADYNTTFSPGYTGIDVANPANLAGVLTSFQAWANTNVTGAKIGTFYYVSGVSFAYRNHSAIGNITAGSVQTFTGLSVSVAAGDYIGWYAASGALEQNSTGGTQVWYVGGDYFQAGTHAYTASNGAKLGLYGTGISAAAVTTQDATVVTASGCMANGNITDTGGSGNDVTARGFFYKVGTSGDPGFGDSTVQETGAFGVGAFALPITDLAPNTSYRVRSFVGNAVFFLYYGSTTVQMKTSPVPHNRPNTINPILVQ